MNAAPRQITCVGAVADTAQAQSFTPYAGGGVAAPATQRGVNTSAAVEYRVGIRTYRSGIPEYQRGTEVYQVLQLVLQLP
jgi:hypothetical protein